MSIIRQADRRRYASISSDALNDAQLSFRARGLLGFLLSKPSTWRCDSERLAANATEGRDAVRKAMNELEQAGYMLRLKQRDGRGRYTTETIVFESPADRLQWVLKHGDDTLDLHDGFSVAGPTCTDAPTLQVTPGTDPPAPDSPTPGSPTVGKPGPSVKTESKTPPVGPPDGDLPNEGSRRRRSCALPSGWQPDEVLLGWAAEKFPNVDPARETEQFADHHRAKGSTMKDWDAAWRTWIRNADQWAPRRPNVPSSGLDPTASFEFDAPAPTVRAAEAVAYMPAEARALYDPQLLLDGALACLEQNPDVHISDLAIAAELYAELRLTETR